MGAVGEQLRGSRASLAEVMSNTGLRRLAAALTGSVVGDWAYALAVSVYVYAVGGPTAVGVLGVARYVLVAVALPFGAALADRYDRKVVMIAADAVRFALVILAAALIWADSPPVFVYVLAVVVSLAGTPFKPAERALTPQLARHPGELTAANVVASTIDSVSMFLGPAIAGALLAVADVEVVLLFNAATFVWSAAFVARIPMPSPAEQEAAPPATAPEHGPPADTAAAAGAEARGFLADAAYGYRLILGQRDLRLMVSLYCSQTLVAGASLVFSVAIALDLLDIGKAGLGMLEAVVGVGGIVGGFVALLLAQRGRLATDFGIGVIMWSAPLLLVAGVPEVAAAVVMMAFIGLANSLVDVNAMTILQRLVSGDAMGRVFGAMESAIIGAMALGSLSMPLLIHTIGIRWGLAVLGGSVALVTLLALPALRRIDSTALAPEGLDLLRSVPMLRVLPPATIERLARMSQRVVVPAGTAVFREGDGGDRFYVIESGVATVSIGGEHVRDMTAGESFGEIALLRDVPRTATVVAASELALRTVEREPFVASVTGHGEAAAAADDVVTTWLQVR